MYNVGPYTMNPHKVVWKYVATDLICCVIGSKKEKLIIPDHRLMFIPLSTEIEAHFVCALLNTSIARLIIKSYSIGTQISTHVMENIAVPLFQKSNKLHQEIAYHSQKSHEFANLGRHKELRIIENKIDEFGAKIWGLTSKELDAAQRYLEELR